MYWLDEMVKTYGEQLALGWKSGGAVGVPHLRMDV